MRPGCAYVLGALAYCAWCALTPPGSRTEPAAPDQDSGDVSNPQAINTCTIMPAQEFASPHSRGENLPS